MDVKYNKTKQEVMDALEFREGPHIYVYNGMRIPSVTQVIDPLLPYFGVPQHIREAAMLRGSLVHKLTELEDSYAVWLPDAYECGLDGYVRAWQSFKQHLNVGILESEQRVYHRVHRYAGTFDRIATIGGSVQHWIIDLKTGGLVPQYALQTAAYQLALEDGRYKKGQLRRMVVALSEDGRYTTEEHSDPTDADAFIAALTLGNWRKAHGC